jgi:hypothetical protein
MRLKTDTIIFVGILSTLCALIACQGKSSEQKTAAMDCLKALRKVEAATQVESTYEQYSQLVIEAKSRINQVFSKLPAGEIKSELNAAIDAYADASTILGAQKNLKMLYLSLDFEPGATLIPKYKIQMKQVPNTIVANMSAGIICHPTHRHIRWQK